MGLYTQISNVDPDPGSASGSVFWIRIGLRILDPHRPPYPGSGSWIRIGLRTDPDADTGVKNCLKVKTLS